MKNKISDIIWGIFAFFIGGLFIFGGVQHIFFKKLPEYEHYTEFFGILAIAIGILIIYSWFRQRSKKELSLKKSNKKSWYIYISIIGILLIISNLFVNNNIEKNNTNYSKSINSDFNPSMKELNIDRNFVEHLDTLSLIYSNFKYGFSMDFPDNWTLDHGVAEHTIIRGVQKDSSITFVVIVIEINDKDNDNITVWDLWDNNNAEMKNMYHNMFQKQVNAEIQNVKYRKVYVSNREAIETRFNHLVKGVDIEYMAQSIVYSIIIYPYTYIVGFHVPKIIFNLNPNKYDYLIDNFVFLK